ncbi:MAG TPA: inorganic phosphate transporter [Stellaceae bacterium]|jgi:PiT family inorganic phosphate transporter|nr:inorganic phosphate transporter [Stellaceae bacterium]
MTTASLYDTHIHKGGHGLIFPLVITVLLGIGIVYAGIQLYNDISSAPVMSALPYILLGIALLIALAFEMCNGFHDTSNAVATVIYTHSLPPTAAVMWSGAFNFLGVLTSTGAVAFGIISLLPVELILQVGSDAGFAMVFALLIAAIIWNFGTWYLGIPNSSSHALIGSIIGVGLANQFLANAGSGTSGVDWMQAVGVIKSLLFSPLCGFILAAALLFLAKFLIKIPALYKAPEGNQPPPWWIRGLLILTCTGVSFAHGSNDGQKGMGLIMLILIGTVPTTYALNKALPDSQMAVFQQSSTAAAAVATAHAGAAATPSDPRAGVEHYLQTRQFSPDVFPALSGLMADISKQVGQYGTLAKIPNNQVRNTRNDMYLASEAVRLLNGDAAANLSADDKTTLGAYKKSLDNSTKFIPSWVKVLVAIALGIGTMIGWKRIVVTVGEKIGKEHLTYAQGASAELVAMGTIFAADAYGLPVSTTHILTSGVAGTMAANGSGLQWGTMKSLALAWVLTLPAAITLSGCLFALFVHLF